MFTKRIIPCLDCKDGRVVKGTNFVDLRDAGDPVEVASMYDKSGADELVFLDITASSDVRNTTVDLVRRVAERVQRCYYQFGGIIYHMRKLRFSFHTQLQFDKQVTQQFYTLRCIPSPPGVKLL